MKDCKVLVVHDDEDVRQLLADFLTEEGFPVEQAVNGLEAMRKMKAGYRPDVILTDLLMPVMDGYELNQELKRHQAWSSIPLLVLTAGGLISQRLSDFEEVLQMPLDLNHLLARLKIACLRRPVG